MANTGFKGINFWETDNLITLDAFLIASAGTLVTSTTTLALLELQVASGTPAFKTYDWSSNTFKSSGMTTGYSTKNMTYCSRIGDSDATVDTGIFVASLATLTGFTKGAKYYAIIYNASASNPYQVFKMQFGSTEGDMTLDANNMLKVDIEDAGGAAAAFYDTGGVNYLSVDVFSWVGAAVAEPGTAGLPDVNMIKINGTAQTGRDLGASVLLSPGTGTGQLSITSGVVAASVAGAVGSVTGAVGSVTGNIGGNVSGNVTGSVGSVTGNVGGNVVGSVASVSGAVGSVTGAVGSVSGDVGGSVVGDVEGKVIGGGSSSITGSGVQASSVVGAVGSVTGAVGSVTGGVGGSVAGDIAGKVLGGGASSITGSGVIAASVAGAVGSVTGAVGSVTAGVSLTSGERTTLAGVIWGVLTSAITGAGSVGKGLVGMLTDWYNAVNDTGTSDVNFTTGMLANAPAGGGGLTAQQTADAVNNLAPGSTGAAGSIRQVLAALSAGSGAGSYTIIQPVQTSLGAAMQNVTVSMFLSGDYYTAITDSSGNATFNLNAGTYAQSASYPGYTVTNNGSVVVSGNATLTAIVGTKTSISPAAPNFCTVAFAAYSGGIPATGVVFTATMTAASTGAGIAYVGEVETATSDGSGNVVLTLPQTAQYQIANSVTRATFTVNVPATTTYQIPDVSL